VINGKSTLKLLEEIPLGFNSVITENFTISIDHLKGKLNYSTIYLQDNLLNIKHNLKDSDYTFSLTETGNFNNRFKLIIETNGIVLNIETIDYKSNLIIKNSSNNLVLKTSDETVIKKVLIYDMLGKEILVKNNKFSSIELKSPVLKSNSVLIIKTLLETGAVVINKIYKN